ncbi:cytochrome ubiquinol oxidase subunit I [Streptomyces rhizosphaerihabitans]|uniref:cytochrome ubiquinol oxidase subunit I n=1 Tax=Streptomyces rhizosphaerihabitans TaxID=1266770 RepID=UPI0021C0D722|nr:cytochrome ubiquinol oxidase subunit I [Streptomyces rhizosphaerihabitans]MCT9010880.1 cytochrome ubiquinol oxidase subunit I [Streptomyces rhizosphaerihabitans]
MSQLDLARLQFAMTSIYHFLFVPVTIGLALLTALLQTAWYRGGQVAYLRLTRFFGTLLVINVAVGVVTGLVQEFQFGMDWSGYSRTVGDVFGAPLAMEGLAAFFLESTFLGLWIFGWDKLSKRVHLATIWAVAGGSALSALFIMAANSWMQHPVGYKVDPSTGRPQLDDVWALFTNPVFLRGYLHVLLAALVTGSMVMLSVSAWQLRKDLRNDNGGTKDKAQNKAQGQAQAQVQDEGTPDATKEAASGFRLSARLSLFILVPALMFAMLVGSELGVTEGKYQPMKIAAAEAQWETCQPCSFSLFQIGGGNNDQTPTKILEIPHLLSLLATNHWNGKVLGLNEVNSQYQQAYGPGDYVPDVFIQYWAMRVMAYLASLALLLGLWGLWLLRRERLTHSRLFLNTAVWAVLLPFLINTSGWLLTENGRQPWIVQGLQLTKNGVSSSVSTAEVAISIVAFFLLYAAMAVIAAVLMTRHTRKGTGPLHQDDQPAPEMTY